MNKQKKMIIGAVVILVVIVGAVLAIKGSSSPTMSNSASGVDASSAVATNSVAIQNYMYMPNVIKVKVGTTVTWTNKDEVQHSVTADTASSNAPSGPLISQNQTYSYTFKKAGTYTLHCILHPYMHSAVIVTS